MTSAAPGDDLGVARKFYIDGLGFQVSFEVSDDGRTGILGLERGTIRIAIDCPMPGHGRDACVALEVESADAYYEEWRHELQINATRVSGARREAQRAPGRELDQDAYP